MYVLCYKITEGRTSNLKRNSEQKWWRNGFLICLIYVCLMMSYSNENCTLRKISDWRWTDQLDYSNSDHIHQNSGHHDFTIILIDIIWIHLDLLVCSFPNRNFSQCTKGWNYCNAHYSIHTRKNLARYKSKNKVGLSKNVRGLNFIKMFEFSL